MGMAATLGVVLVFSLVGMLGLYLLISRETASSPVYERSEAARDARRFGGRSQSDRDPDRSDVEESTPKNRE